MSTIAKMVIEATVDPRGVKRGIADVVAVMEKMQRVAKNRIKLELQFPELKNVEFAQRAVSQLESQFRNAMTDLNEQLFRGKIDTKAFKAGGVQAAKDFNDGLSTTIDRLGSQGILTGKIHQSLVSQYKKAGLDAGTALAQGSQRGIAAHPLLGNLTTQGQRAANSLLNGLNKVFQQRSGELKEQFVNRQITVQQYRRRGQQAAEEFDHGLSQGLADLRAKGQATEAITQALVSSFKLAGLKSANAFAFSLDKQMGERTTRLGTTLSQFLTAPIVAAGAASVKLGADFELSMNRIQAILEPTSDELARLRDQARKLGAESQFSAKDAAEAQAKLAQQGLKTGEILAAMPVILNVAAAGMTSMTEAADAATTIMFGFGIAADSIGPAMDKVVKLTLISKSSLQDLQDAFRVVGPSARAAGQDFDTVAAAIGALSKAGAKGQLGGTALRGILQRLISPTKQARQALTALGIEAIDPTTKRMRDLIDIVDQFRRAQAKFRPDQFQEAFSNIFRDRAGTAMNVLLRTGADGLNQLREQLRNAGGTAQRVGDVQMSGFTGALRELQSALQEVAQALADSGLLRDLTQLARGFAGFLLQLSKTNPEILKLAVYFSAVVAAIGPMLFILGKVITSIANLRSIIALLNGPSVLAGLVSIVSAGAPLLVGLALLAGLFALIAKKAKEAQEQMAAMQNVADSLSGMSREQLTALRNQTLAEIEGNQKLLSALLAADKKRANSLKGIFTLPDEKIGNVGRLIQFQKDVLASIDNAIRRVDGTVKDTSGTVAGLTGDFENFADGLTDVPGLADKSKSALDVLADRVGTLSSLTKIWGSSLREHQDLVQALLIAYAGVNDLISRQPDLLSKDAAQLLQMKADLEDIFGTVEFKFAEIPGKELLRMLGMDKPLPLQVRPMIIGTTGPEPQSLIDKAFDSFKKAAQRAASSKIEIDLFKDAGLKVPADLLAAYNEQVRVADSVEKSLISTVRASNLGFEAKEAIIKDINTLLGEYKDKANDSEHHTVNLVTSLEGFASAARGILHVAQAFGHISQEAEAALTAVADLADATANFVKSVATGDVFGAITSAVGAVGSLIQLGNSLFGESPGDKERKQIVKDNTLALSDLAREINGFQVNVQKIQSVKPITDEIIAAVKKSLVQRGNKTFGNIDFKSVETLDAQLRAVGSSFEELQAIAKDLGINLFNEKGRLSAAGLDALNKAMELQIQKLTQFGKSLDAQRDKLELRRNVFNLDTSGVGAIQDAMTLLNQFAPGIAKMFAGFDATTTEGRAQIEAALQTLFNNLDKQLISKDQFGQLDITGLSDIIKMVADALDGLRDTTQDVNKEMVNVPAGFKIERFRFAAMATKLTDAVKTVTDSVDPGADPLKNLKDMLGAISIDVNKTVPQFQPLKDAVQSLADVNAVATDELGSFIEALRLAVTATQSLTKSASLTSKEPAITSGNARVTSLTPATQTQITGGGSMTLIIQANVQQTSDPEEWYAGVKQVAKDKVRAKYGANAVTRVEENMP